MMKKKFLLYCFFCFAFTHSFAQPFELRLHGSEKDSFLFYTKLALKYPSFIECNEALKTARLHLLELGYLTSSIDSLQWNDQVASASVQLGKKYVWASLKNKNIPSALLAQTHFNENDFLNKPIELKKVIPYFDKMLRFLENNGHPFASFYFDSLQFSDKGVATLLYLDQGPLTKFDTIVLNEDAKVSRHYLLQYLGLKQGAFYDESLIKRISTRIQELPFLAEAYPWKVTFNATQTKLNLYVKNKSANKADVLMGLLPNNSDYGGKFLLTGDVKLALANALGQGESISLNWQNLQYQSPRYNVLFQFPYLLNSPIGISGKFDFYKKDTSFVNVNGELGLIYQFSANDQLKVYYELASTRVKSLNVANLQATRRLPDNGDVAYKTFGTELILHRVDYKLNPRKGYRILFNAGVSIRNVIKNTSVESTLDLVNNQPFSYLYDSVKLKSYKYSIKSNLQYYHPLSKRLILASLYQGGITYSSTSLFKNELFQIGGYRLMRGFDEGSLFVNSYSVFTLEPRYLLSLNSYFFLFSDLGFVHSKYAAMDVNDRLWSLGLGMTFETKAGLFNLSYAMGSRENQSFQFKSSKIHFGYINYF